MKGTHVGHVRASRFSSTDEDLGGCQAREKYEQSWTSWHPGSNTRVGMPVRAAREEDRAEKNQLGLDVFGQGWSPHLLLSASVAIMEASFGQQGGYLFY